MTQKVLGIVSRAANYRDHDRVLTLITRESGKLTATARGCRKPQSKLLVAASPFCYGEYVLQEVQGRFYVSQCDVREIFYDLRLRPEALAGAAYATAICEEFANPGEEYLKPFSLLLSTLKNLTMQEYDPRGSIVFFLAKMLRFEGYELQMDRCVLCDTTDELCGLDAEMGGVVCKNCMQENGITQKIRPQERELLAALGRVPSAAYDQIVQRVQKQLGVLPILDAYMRELVVRKLPALELLNV